VTRAVASIALSASVISCAPPPVATSRSERQVTEDTGTARSPVLSPDGTLVAFVAGVGNRSTPPQVWVRALEGSAPAIRLTDPPSQNYDPEFTGDGRAVYFTSTREPPGIYRIPVIGGASELAVPGGYTARVSPNGKTLVYGVNGRLYRRSVDRDDAVALLPVMEHSYTPVWSPDSRRVLMLAKMASDREPVWWSVPIGAEEPPRQTMLGADLQARGFTDAFVNAWLPGDWIVFTGSRGETRTLWKAHFTLDGRVDGACVRATDDPQGDADASARAGRLVFARTRVDMNLWALPLDSSGERVTGPPERLTAGPARKGSASISRDGQRLLYGAEEARDRFALILKDLRTERWKRLQEGFFAHLSPDGSRYVSAEETDGVISLRSRFTGWWPFWSRRLCEDCGMPYAFSTDGTKLLLWTPAPPHPRLNLIDLGSREVRPVMIPGAEVSGPSLSPDGDWISMVLKNGTHSWQTVAVRDRGDRVVTASNWVPVSAVSDAFHFAFWSEDGRILYRLTGHGRGNLRWLEAQRLDQKTKHAVGPRLQIYEFDDSRVPTMDPVWNTVTVAHNRIILELGETTADIWLKN
jgi:hypothetical protein